AMLEAIGNALRIPELRRKILFTLGLFVVFRILAHIAVPGADKAALDKLFNSNAFLGLLDLFSGGGLSTFSIIAMGVNPYINASIIMQLMTVVSTRIKELSREGEYGRRKITCWTRWLTVAIVVTAFIIEVQQAQRKIPIQSAQRVVGRKVYQGRSSHLPLRVNQAGVIPIIFAISIMFFPVIIGNFLATAPGIWGEISRALR